MRTQWFTSVGLATVLVVGACASTGVQRGAEQEDETGPVAQRNGATILTGAALHRDETSVLTALSGKVPGFRVQRHTGECPEILMRNTASIRAGARITPHVYVDGTRATDTCILESLRTGDVERVEVYPQGFTTRPGYGTHAHGLILVFMRSG